LGYSVKLGAATAPADGPATDDDEPPIRAVHFSNFIIQ
jgi:hypothetical protein